MNCKDDILIELETLSPLVAGVPKNNVFSVPQGYFETLGDTILVCINETLSTAADDQLPGTGVPQGYFDNLSLSILDKIKGQQNNEAAEPVLPAIFSDIHRAATIFEVPADYFTNFPATILDKIKAQAGRTDSEEMLSSSLTAARSTNIFEVPDGYFKHLPFEILDKIKSLSNNPVAEQKLSPLLLKAQPVNVFEVPKGYFDNLPAAIINKITTAREISPADEIKTLSPLLHSLQQTNVFEIPEGYFNDSAVSIVQSIKPVPAKVVSMRRPGLFRKLAAAAVITGAMALGVYKYAERQPASSGTRVVTLASNIVKVAPGLDSAIVKGKNMDDQQFDDALNNLSKDDITNYLEKNNSEEDMASLTSDVDENALPDKDDYLLDEKTLENYLDEIKSQN